MAGYIFNLDSFESLKLYVTGGVYATRLSAAQNRRWMAHHEGTFADYVTMQPGNNIYFFIKRKIYGIGKLINISGDCKYFNFPGAGEPISYIYQNCQRALLWDEGEFSVNQRVVCFFVPDPHFFLSGVDMDDVLESRPAAFKMLRAFWKLSFIKFDDEENQAFRDVILKLNQDAISSPVAGKNVFATQYENTHLEIEKKINKEHTIDIFPILKSCVSNDSLAHEMALEAGLLQQLNHKEAETARVFGAWDYLSHQVIASPFKPIDYMDKMDIFGYSFIPGFRPTKSKFLVVELKKDIARKEDLEQLMKYVDWIKTEYCFGDYSMICAFLVAYDFNQDVQIEKNNIGVRKYTVGMKPAVSKEWQSVTLVEYSFNLQSRKIDFFVKN